jgi:hypothetical protein
MKYTTILNHSKSVDFICLQIPVVNLMTEMWKYLGTWIEIPLVTSLLVPSHLVTSLNGKDLYMHACIRGN